MSVQMLKEGEDADIEVSREDQNNINTFSKLNARVEFIEEQLEEKKKEKEYLDDLTTELELADEDEPVKFRLADAFLNLSIPHARRRLERMASGLDKEIADLERDAGKWREQMTELKAVLYGRFGKSINLEK
ncbi:Prefoldin, subunit 4 [Gonapodya prolifera JEL478]|uniref:Prefoldin subunit 4 n=1 Tax=Gonapodya prolifera (strain JEL478) TaxID=1344416 RepID=A0A139AZA2_GONPJ|nr:Prefoldin, subunit 4 [Gonapodya prolifera JEL478]|eukprot:KXS22030.1 Prefoldin, subunit 4 [Gonapodya prolifera JEL478]